MKNLITVGIVVAASITALAILTTPDIWPGDPFDAVEWQSPATLTRHAAERHPPPSKLYLGSIRLGGERQPPSTQYADLMAKGIDGPPALTTRHARANPQRPIRIVLQFGTKDDHFVLSPEMLRLETGELYQLVIVNPGKIPHFVLAPEFGAEIGSLALMQGGELKPGSQHVWNFVAERAGTYEIRCASGIHAKAGMAGTIIVVDGGQAPTS